MSTPTGIRMLTQWATEWGAIVDYADGSSVIVRHHARKRRRYRCTECGQQDEPICAHVKAAVLALTTYRALTQNHPVGTGRVHEKENRA